MLSSTRALLLLHILCVYVCREVYGIDTIIESGLMLSYVIKIHAITDKHLLILFMKNSK